MADTQYTSLLTRIADSLERLAPAPAKDADPRSGGHFRWTGAHILSVRAAAPLPPGRFVGVEHQMAAIRQNMLSLAKGDAAHDMLLWGSRGTGKSALVRSLAQEAGLTLVEAAGDTLSTLPALFERLADVDRAFLIYVDDLAFNASDRDVRILRSVLDGGISARPDNIRLAVTSNHRHLVDREATHSGEQPGGPRHARDVADDQLALVDRFGLTLGFHVPTQDQYVEMVRRHLEAEGLDLDEKDAIAFALARGSRSGRTAWHYRNECMSRRAAAG